MNSTCTKLTKRHSTCSLGNYLRLGSWKVLIRQTVRTMGWAVNTSPVRTAYESVNYGSVLTSVGLSSKVLISKGVKVQWFLDEIAINLSKHVSTNWIIPIFAQRVVPIMTVLSITTNQLFYTNQLGIIDLILYSRLSFHINLKHLTTTRQSLS